MKRLLLILTIGLISVNSYSQTDCNIKKEDISIDRNIIPNESVGLITSSTTKSALNKLYDKENIRETVVFSYEGFDIKGTEVIFDNTADNITIEWNVDNLTQPKIIRIKNLNSNWKTKEALELVVQLKK